MIWNVLDGRFGCFIFQNVLQERFNQYVKKYLNVSVSSEDTPARRANNLPIVNDRTHSATDQRRRVHTARIKYQRTMKPPIWTPRLASHHRLQPPSTPAPTSDLPPIHHDLNPTRTARTQHVLPSNSAASCLFPPPSPLPTSRRPTTPSFADYSAAIL